MNANSIAATPRRSRRKSRRAAWILSRPNIVFVPLLTLRRRPDRRSTDQLAAAIGDITSRPGECLGLASICGQDAARAVDDQGVDDHDEAALTTASAAAPAERKIGMGYVHDASDVPCSAGERDVHTGGQFGVLVECEVFPEARSRGDDIDSARAHRRMNVAPPYAARKHHGEGGAV